MTDLTLKWSVSCMGLQMPADFLLTAEPLLSMSSAVVPVAVIMSLARSDMLRCEMNGKIITGGE